MGVTKKLIRNASAKNLVRLRIQQVLASFFTLSMQILGYNASLIEQLAISEEISVQNESTFVDAEAADSLI